MFGEAGLKSEQEEGITVVDQSRVPPVKNALIFRFLSRKNIGIKDLGAALNAIWKPSSPATVYTIGENVYLVSFECMADCNRILAKQPWNLSNTLMVFKKAFDNEKIAELSFSEVSFWVQAHGLEIQLHTRYVGELLGNKLGRVLEVDCASDSIAWGKCLRFRGSSVEFNGI